MATILILNGPNLNLLGKREPDVYGHETLDEINANLQKSTQHSLTFFQSNAEHELIDRIQQTLDDGTDFILFNPAAFTHTSIALRDALLATQTPFIEVHLTDPQMREDFRKTSYFTDIAVNTISGLGAQSYMIALQATEDYFSQEN